MPDDLLGKDIGGLIIEPTKSAVFSANLKYYRLWKSMAYPMFLSTAGTRCWRISPRWSSMTKQASIWQWSIS